VKRENLATNQSSLRYAPKGLHGGKNEQNEQMQKFTEENTEFMEICFGNDE